MNFLLIQFSFDSFFFLFPTANQPSTSIITTTDKAEMIAVCLILSIVVASLLFLVFLSTNQLIILRHPTNNSNDGKSCKSKQESSKKKKPFSPKKALTSSPFRLGGRGSGRCEIDGLDDTTVDQLLEELDPVLVNSIGINDSLNNHQMALTSSHHSFHDFRAHSKPLITDGLPFPASSGQTYSFTSSLSRNGGQGINRLSFGRPIQPPTAPIAITPPTMTISSPIENISLSSPPPPPTINCLYHHQTDSNPRSMTGTVNSYF